MATLQQYEREKIEAIRREIRERREARLRLLAQSRASANPREMRMWAGFWLDRQAPEGQRAYAR